MGRTVKYARKAVVAITGGLLLILGLILIPLPGPGFLVIFAGIFVLSLEFAWFEQHVERTRKLAKSAVKPRKKR